MGNVSHGPSIVTDGLVLCLDKYNEQSYLGQPTSNEARYYPTGDYETYRNWVHQWVNSGAHTTSGNATDVPKPKGFENSPMRVTSSEVTTIGSLHFANGLRFVNASTQYSFSIYFRQNRAGTPSSGYSPYMRGGNENFSKGSLSYNGGTNASNWPVNEWIRLEGTCTSGSSETYLYISQYIGSYVGDKVWLFAPQIEQKPHVTKFVYTERSATDGWQDLSGNDNHADLTQLAYSATNVPGTNVNDFSFDGTDDRVISDNHSIISDIRGDFSVGMWLKFGGTSSSHHIPFWISDSNGNGFVYIELGSNYGYLGAATETKARNGYVSGANINDNNWHYIVVTRSTGASVVIYKDGTSQTVTTHDMYGSWNIGSGGDMSVGVGMDNGSIYSSSYYEGNCSFITTYNRVITASEVLRNYNANKGRYGL